MVSMQNNLSSANSNDTFQINNTSIARELPKVTRSKHRLLLISITSLISVILLFFLSGISFNYYDKIKSFEYAKTITNPVIFDKAGDYYFIANQVDAFNVPFYFWSSRKTYFHNYTWRFSPEPVITGIVFFKDGKFGRINIIGEGIEGNFSVEKTSSGSKPDSSDTFTKFLSYIKKGTLIRASIITGSPEKFEEDINISKGMIYAQKKGVEGAQLLPILKNAKQITINERYVFPTYEVVIHAR